MWGGGKGSAGVREKCGGAAGWREPVSVRAGSRNGAGPSYLL